MHPIHLGLSLFIVAALSACGDSSTSGSSTQTDPAAASAPGPWDTLAALAPEDQPYGQDVYTEKCLSCHGDLGQGVGKNPSLKGLSSTAMQLKLLDYRAAKVKNTKADLSDAEIAAASIYAGD